MKACLLYTSYPANLIELGYHDNYDDLRWIENHLDAAAQADRKSTRLNSSHVKRSRMPSSA